MRTDEDELTVDLESRSSFPDAGRGTTKMVYGDRCGLHELSSAKVSLVRIFAVSRC